MYFTHIDGLRAIAVILVVLFHLDIDAFSGGYIGVDVFFVISGFLITLQISQAKNNNNFSILNFYKRRAKRIFPALVSVVFLTLIVGIFLFTPWDLERLAKVSISSVLGGANLYFWNESGYFDVSSKYKPLLHIWSLGVEMQFYLIAPFLLFIIFKMPKKILPTLFVVVIIFSLIALKMFEDGFTYFSFLGNTFSDGPASIFYLLPFRLFEFFIGSAAFFIHKNEYNWLRKKAALLGSGMIASSAYLIDNNVVFPSYLALIPCFGAFLVIYGSCGWFSEVILGNGYVKYIGKTSYSIYLVHWPIIVFFTNLSEETLSISDKFLIVVLTLFFSYLSYSYIERRFHLKKEQIEENKKSHLRNNYIKFSSFAFSLTILISLLIISGNGWKWRINTPTKIVTTSEFNQLLPCRLNDVGNICEFGNGEHIETIWIGDSLMEHYLPVAPDVTTGRSLAFVRGGCIFLPISTRIRQGVVDKKCAEVKNSALNYLRENYNKTVVLSQFWDGYFGKKEDIIGLENGSNYKEKYHSKISLLNASLDAFNEITSRNNHQVILLNHTIYEDFNRILKCLNTPINLCGAVNVNITKERLISNRVINNELVDGIRKRGIKYFDPLNNFCDENENCNLMFQEKNILLRDRIHYSLNGALKATSGLSDVIAETYNLN